MTLLPSSAVHGRPCMDARMMVVGYMGVSCPQGAGRASTARTHGLLLAWWRLGRSLCCSQKPCWPRALLVAHGLAGRTLRWPCMAALAARSAGRAWLCWSRLDALAERSAGRTWRSGSRMPRAAGRVLVAAVVAMHPRVFPRIFGGYTLVCMAKPA
ncbi:hypothetical protein Dimus_031729 [Dionaea muscipula]